MLTRMLLALVLVLGLVAPAAALTLTQTGAVVDVSWDEPTDNFDGTPLTDLAYTYFEWQFEGDAAWTKAPDIPATALTGGGHITTQLSVTVLPGQEKTIRVRAYAVDTAPVPNVSDPSDTATLKIDRKKPNKPR